MTTELETLVRELSDAATGLRTGDLDAMEAAALVERCAELAGRVGAELDRAAREAEREPPAEGQEELL